MKFRTLLVKYLKEGVSPNLGHLIEAGTQKRAPKNWQKIGMEWLYRCMKEPKRLFKRYFVDDMQFFYYLGKQLLGIYKDPFRKK